MRLATARTGEISWSHAMSLPQERTYYGRRLMERREEAGLDPFEMAAFLGIQPAWYFDLEAQDDLLLHFPLSQVARLLEKLDLSVEQLFSPPGQEHRCSQMFNLMDLLRGIRKFQEASRISVPESKAYLSYDLDEALADPATVWDW
ncbi:MAG TPA: hypothetical protein VLJ39_18290, partial [Tepidisphaeraceae bacterium]|nr:hypothetical protein [Tepidisphaeraceae bacterium]